MSEYTSVCTIVAVIQATLECCRTVQQHPDDVTRIAARLASFMAAKDEWENKLEYGDVLGSNSKIRLHDVLCDIFLCIQAAGMSAKSKRSEWPRKLKVFFVGKDVLEELINTECILDIILKDLGFDPTADMLFPIDESKHRMDRLQSFFDSLDAYDFSLADSNVCKRSVGESFIAAILDFHLGKYDDCFHDSVNTIHASDDDGSIEESMAIDVNKLAYGASIGYGGFSTIYEGLYAQERVAVKVIEIFRNSNVSRHEDMSPTVFRSECERARDEALIMKICSIHPNIVEVMGYYAPLDYKTKPLIVMELMESSLHNLLHNRKVFLRYTDQLKLMKGVASAIEFLHLQGIVHQDIKTSNILVDHVQVVAKLTDFGVAYIKGAQTTWQGRHNSIVTTTRKGMDENLAGTCIYQAPELILNEVEDVSRVAEVYSLGVTMWECLTREIPHNGLKSEAEKKAKTEGMLMLPFPVARESPLSLDEQKKCSILERTAFICLSKNRGKRPNASQILRYLNCSTEFPDEINEVIFGPKTGDIENANSTSTHDQDNFEVFDAAHDEQRNRDEIGGSSVTGDIENSNWTSTNQVNAPKGGTQTFLIMHRRCIAIISFVVVVAVILIIAVVPPISRSQSSTPSHSPVSRSQTSMPSHLHAISPIQFNAPIPAPTPSPASIPSPTSSGTCGDGDLGNGVCSNGMCCSKWGYCGTTSEYCPTESPASQP